MSEEYGPDFVSVTDDDGNVIPASEYTDGESLLADIDDEAELNAVYEKFMEELFEDEEE